MSSYVNPDAPNPEITDAAVRSMLMQSNPSSGYVTTGFYPGGNANPFASSQNVTAVPSPESRANGMPTMSPLGYLQPQTGMMPQQQYNPMQTGIAPNWVPGTGSYNQLSMMNQQALMNQGYQMPVGGYNGYPIGVDPSNYIYEYMKNNVAPKKSWGENYWTMPRPVQQPPIDWTVKPQQYMDPYAQYCGMPTMPQAPMLPPNFSFPMVQETWFDTAKKNWKNI